MEERGKETMGFTDEELAGLSEEERAALEEDDDAKGEAEGDEGGTDDERGKAGEGEGDDGDKGKTLDDGDKGGDQGADEGADNDKSDAGAAENVAPVNSPLFKLDAGAEGKTLEGITEELKKLDEQFEEGDIPLKDYNAQRDALNQAKFRMEMYDDINKQVATQAVENNWKTAQMEFFEENESYRDNPDLNAAFVRRVNNLLATDDGKKMSDRAILQKAREELDESLGLGKGKSTKEDADPGKDALAEAKKKEAEKGRDGMSLRDIPKSQEAESGDKYDALDKLEGEEFEKAVAALSDAERQAYAVRG